MPPDQEPETEAPDVSLFAAIFRSENAKPVKNRTCLG